MEYYTFECYYDNWSLDKILYGKAFKSKDNAINYLKETLKSLKPCQWFYPIIRKGNYNEVVEVRPHDEKIIVKDDCVMLEAKVEERVVVNKTIDHNVIIDGKVYSRQEVIPEVIKDWMVRADDKHQNISSTYSVRVYVRKETLTFEDNKTL